MIDVCKAKEMVQNRDDEYVHLLRDDSVEIGFVSIPDDTHTLVYYETESGEDELYGSPSFDDAVQKMNTYVEEFDCDTVVVEHPEAVERGLPV